MLRALSRVAPPRLAARVALDPFFPRDADGAPRLFFGESDDCPVCTDQMLAFAVFQCGHATCVACHERRGAAARCVYGCAEGALAETYPSSAALEARHAAFARELARLAALTPGPAGPAARPAPVPYGAGGDAVVLDVPHFPGGEAATVYVVDHSSSMATAWATMLREGFFDDLALSLVGTHCAVVAFSTEARTVVEPCLVTREGAAAVAAAIGAARPHGSTALHLALRLARREAARLEALAPGACARIVVLTDGEATDLEAAKAAVGEVAEALLVCGFGAEFNFEMCAEMLGRAACGGAGSTLYEHAPTVPELLELLRRRVRVRRMRVRADGPMYFNGRVSLPVDGWHAWHVAEPLRVAFERASLESLTLDGAPVAVERRAELGFAARDVCVANFALGYIAELSFCVPEHDVVTHAQALRAARSALAAVGPSTRPLLVTIDARLEAFRARLRGHASDSNGLARMLTQTVRSFSCTPH
jgi:hypothetical protein